MTETATANGTDGRTPATTGRRLTRRTRIATALILVLALAEGSALTIRYFLTDHRFVIADNAQVDGDTISINAPTEGRVVDWRVDTGSFVNADQVVGRVQVLGNATGPRMPIKAPGRGTVVATTVSNGMYVDAGALLATAYDLTSVYVTARIREENIDGVHVGAPVDVLVDAAAGSPLPGTVSSIGATSSGVNQLSADPSADPLNLEYPIYPGSDTDPQNPQSVQQYIPVKIVFTVLGNGRIAPGMNATVHIHRQ